MVDSLQYQQGATLTLGGEGRKQLLRLLREHHESNPAAMDAALAREGMRYGEMRNATIAELCTMAYVCDLWKSALMIHLNHVAKSYMKKHQQYFVLDEVEYGKEVTDNTLADLLRKLSPNLESVGIRGKELPSPKVYASSPSTPSTSAYSSENETPTRKKRRKNAELEKIDRKCENREIPNVNDYDVQHPLITPIALEPLVEPNSPASTACSTSSSIPIEEDPAIDVEYDACTPVVDCPNDYPRWTPESFHQISLRDTCFCNPLVEAPGFLDGFLQGETTNILEPLNYSTPNYDFSTSSTKGLDSYDYYQFNDNYPNNTRHYSDGDFDEAKYLSDLEDEMLYEQAYMRTKETMDFQKMAEEILQEKMERDELAPPTARSQEEAAWISACAFGEVNQFF